MILNGIAAITALTAFLQIQRQHDRITWSYSQPEVYQVCTVNWHSCFATSIPIVVGVVYQDLFVSGCRIGGQLFMPIDSSRFGSAEPIEAHKNKSDTGAGSRSWTRGRAKIDIRHRSTLEIVPRLQSS